MSQVLPAQSLAYLPLSNSSPTVRAALDGPTHVPQIGTPVHGPPAAQIVRAILFVIATTATLLRPARYQFIQPLGRRLLEASPQT